MKDKPTTPLPKNRRLAAPGIEALQAADLLPPNDPATSDGYLGACHALFQKIEAFAENDDAGPDALAGELHAINEMVHALDTLTPPALALDEIAELVRLGIKAHNKLRQCSAFYTTEALSELRHVFTTRYLLFTGGHLVLQKSHPDFRNEHAGPSSEFMTATLNAVALAEEVNALPENERAQVLETLGLALSADIRPARPASYSTTDNLLDLYERRRYDSTHIDMETTRSRIERLTEQLAQELREAPMLGAVVRSNQTLVDVFASGTQAVASSKNADQPKSVAQNQPAAGLPDTAPESWSRRDPNVGETSIAFLQRVYGSWLDQMQLQDIADLDEPLYQALQTWRRRHKGPAQLKSFFSRQRRSASEVDAELKKYNIKKPEDAFTRFPNDRPRAQRLYQACRTRLGLR